MSYADGKMRDLRVTLEVLCRAIFIVFSLDLNTSNIDESISSRASSRVHSAKTPRRSYAKGFENVRREGHNSTPLVAY